MDVYNSPIVWTDPRVMAGLIGQWEPATLSLNDGDGVSLYPDLSSYGNNLVQITASKRPLYKTNIQNGRPCLLFDTDNQFLRGTFHKTVDPTGITVIVAAKPSPVVDGTIVPFGIRSGDDITTPYKHFGVLIDNHNAPYGLSFNRGNGTNWCGKSSNNVVTVSGFHIFSLVLDGSIAREYVDGVFKRNVSGVDTTKVLPSKPFYIGYNNFESKGFYLGSLWVFDSALSDTSRRIIERGLGEYWGTFVNVDLSTPAAVTADCF